MSDSFPSGTGHSLRTLTDWLRSRSDSQLVELFRRRPDLALPAPPDMPTLASRLSVRHSVQRALTELDAFRLAVLEIAVIARPHGRQPVSLGELAEQFPSAAPADLDAAVADLLDSALLWGVPDALHLNGGLREALEPYPAGLGRPIAALVRPVPPPFESLDALNAALADLAEPERDLVAHLAGGPPVGVVPEGIRHPVVNSLVQRGLLVPLDRQTVELPREVGLAVRPQPLAAVPSTPPDVEVHRREPSELDRIGTTAVLEFLRLIDRLGEVWTVQPPAQLRSGGLGVRELRRTAKELGVDESVAAVVIEVAYEAGLINDSRGLDPVYLPTPDFDSWQHRSPAARWAEVAQAWLSMARQPDLVGQRDERDRVMNALGFDVGRGVLPDLRRTVLDALAELPPGASPADRAQLLARLEWYAPRRARTELATLQAVLVQADLLGVTAAGGLTGYSRTLLAGSRAVAEQVLASALPDPVDYMLVQPDLTVVVPGPPTAELAAQLALTADLESTGGASVYRISEASLRRALDAGRSAADVAAMIAQRSRTPVPQALSYLIEDLARRHGRLRTGKASSYLRSEDEALLTRVVTDRAANSLKLRRIAPTVVISGSAPAKVLDVLRAAGYAPVAESAEGDVISLDKDLPRAPARQSVPGVRPRSAFGSPGQLTQLVQRVRAGDAMREAFSSRPPAASPVPGVTSAAIMGTLRDAIRSGRRVAVGVAEADGTVTRHAISPISLGGGFVRGQAPGRSGLVAHPLHRITAVHLLDEDDEDLFDLFDDDALDE